VSLSSQLWSFTLANCMNRAMPLGTRCPRHGRRSSSAWLGELLTLTWRRRGSPAVHEYKNRLIDRGESTAKVQQGQATENRPVGVTLRSDSFPANRGPQGAENCSNLPEGTRSE
jgi:hypothetical protein